MKQQETTKQHKKQKNNNNNKRQEVKNKLGYAVSHLTRSEEQTPATLMQMESKFVSDIVTSCHANTCICAKLFLTLLSVLLVRITITTLSTVMLSANIITTSVGE